MPFYALLDEPGNTFVLESHGGSGDITITIEGTAYEIEFEECEVVPDKPALKPFPMDYELVSGKDGTEVTSWTRRSP